MGNSNNTKHFRGGVEETISTKETIGREGNGPPKYHVTFFGHFQAEFHHKNHLNLVP